MIIKFKNYKSSIFNINNDIMKLLNKEIILCYSISVSKMDNFGNIEFYTKISREEFLKMEYDNFIVDTTKILFKETVANINILKIFFIKI